MEKQPYQSLLKALSNTNRVAMFSYIHSEKECSYSSIMVHLNLSPPRDGGRFSYHLKILLKNNLIELNKRGNYQLTKKGKLMMNFLNKLIKDIIPQ